MAWLSGTTATLRLTGVLALGISAAIVSATVAVEADAAFDAAITPGAVTVAATIATEADVALDALAGVDQQVVSATLAEEVATALDGTVAVGAADVAATVAIEADVGLEAALQLGAVAPAATLAVETDAALDASVSAVANVSATVAEEVDSSLDAAVVAGSVSADATVAQEIATALAADASVSYRPFAPFGVWSATWLPDRGITFGGTLKPGGTSPPAVSLVSAPSVLSGLWLDIPVAGVLGVGKVRYSLDDGATYSAPETLAASMTLGGFELTFAAGTYNTNNTYKATVSAWTSLDGYVASQATPGKQPVYSSVAWNGYPSLTFDGVDDILVCTHADWNTLYGGNDTNTVLVCALDSAASTAYRYRVGLYGTAAADVAALNVNATNVMVYNRGGTLHVSDSTATGRRHDLVRNVGTTAAAYVNGVAAGAPGTLDKAASTLASVAIGGYYLNATPGYYTAGNIAAVLIGSTVSDPAGLTAQLNAMGIAHGGTQVVATVADEVDSGLDAGAVAGSVAVSAELATESDGALDASVVAGAVSPDATIAVETDAALDATVLAGAYSASATVAAESDVALDADATTTGGDELAVAITAPSPTAALYSGVTQEISGTYTGSPTEIKAYWDASYTELAGTSTDIGSGTWSLDVVPVYAQVGFTTLYVRAYDGDGYAYDTLAITVTQRAPMDLFAAERSYHAADDSGCTLSGGTPNKFELIPDAKIATSDSRLYQTSDSLRWLVRASDANFAGRRTAYVDSAFGNDIVFLPGSTSQVFGQRSGGKVTTIVLGCCESNSGAIGLLQTGTGGSYGAGRYSDGTLLFADGGSPRTTSHTLRVDVPFALRVEWDDTNNLANWYIYYDDGVTASGSVMWNTAADYAGMYIGSTDYGWYGAFCEILAIDGALGAGEWDAFVAQWLRGRMSWT